MEPCTDGLENYRQLVRKVDELCRHITDGFSHYISCRPGCNTCCKHLSVFPAEGAAISSYLRTLPVVEVERIRHHVSSRRSDSQCPLLESDLCLLYDARPIICRTHGLPIITSSDGTARVDFCPMNFRGVGSLPGSSVLSLETLNTALAAVNAMFVAQDTTGAFSSIDRLSIADAVLLDC